MQIQLQVLSVSCLNWMPSAVWRCAARYKFKKISQDLLSILKMEVVCAYETKATFYHNSRRYNSEHGNIQGRKYKLTSSNSKYGASTLLIN